MVELLHKLYILCSKVFLSLCLSFARILMLTDCSAQFSAAKFLLPGKTQHLANQEDVAMLSSRFINYPHTA